jgi:hypothetical protein
MLDIFSEGKSLPFLIKKCHRLFQDEHNVNPEFLAGKNLHWQGESKGPRDIVLFGDALLILTNSYLWPKRGKFRIWVLSHSHRNLIERIFGLDSKFVGVIPREKIIKTKVSINPWPNFAKESTLVISSRVDAGKNIPLCIHYANFLQKLYPDLRVAVFSRIPLKMKCYRC